MKDRFTELIDLALLVLFDMHTLWLLLLVPLPHKMCRFQIGEDDSLTGEDFSRSIGNGIERVDTRIQTQIAILEQRIARVEAQMESIKDSLFHLQMSVYIRGYLVGDSCICDIEMKFFRRL